MPQLLDVQKRFFSKIPSHDLDALLSLSLQRPKEFIFANPKYSLKIREVLRFWFFLRQYRQGYSIAVLRGHKEFFGLDFLVNKHTLIPRPDTEIMVEAVVKQLAGSTGQTIVIDVGTGTGCIPISIVTSLKHANLKTIAIDISKQALCVAQKNAQLHNATITFLHGNLLEPIFNNETMKQYNNATVVITANLPYLTRKQFQDEPSIKREPYSALVAEENGLALYRELLEQITTKLLPVYKESLTLYFEIDPSQNSAIFELLQKYLPSAHNELRKDFGGHDRLVISTLPTRS